MLRFEKKRHSKSLEITLRSKTPFWSKELITAAGIALFFHISIVLLFSINSPHWSTPLPLSYVQVSTERLGPPINLVLTNPSLPVLDPPPKLSVPLLPFEAEFPISLEGSKKFKSIAFIRGPYPQELMVPDFPSHTTEYARLCIRSDPQGHIFWFAWQQKMSQEPLNRFLEGWLTKLTLLPKNAFQNLLLEIQLAPHD